MVHGKSFSSADALAVTVVGDKAIFAGGWTSVASDVVDIYDADSHQWSHTTLSQPRGRLAATTVGDLALFGGGLASVGPTTLSDTVDVYNASTDQWSVTHLSRARGGLIAATVGDQAFFAGGDNSPSIDVFTVPEPSSLTSLGVAAIGLFGYIWRRRRHSRRIVACVAVVLGLVGCIGTGRRVQHGRHARPNDGNMDGLGEP